ncbi:hypothetical protein C8J57DRAFT_1238075 [Mycena rebaudengoi]|nr:hypothetical protein C8J57DRAFT_1238075 [Mycena rebaudengoi]
MSFKIRNFFISAPAASVALPLWPNSASSAFLSTATNAKRRGFFPTVPIVCILEFTIVYITLIKSNNLEPEICIVSSFLLKLVRLTAADQKNPGLLGDTPFPVPAVVVFQVELFPIPKSSQRRLGIRRIQVVPLIVFGDVVVARYESTCREMVAENPDICLLRCMVSPNIGRAPDNYASYDVAAVFPNEIHRMKQRGIEEVNSPIFGPRPLKMDLDNIFRAIEDELEGDVHNFYRLRE